jgi:hypothetical protein
MLSYSRIWALILLTSLTSHGAVHAVPLHWLRCRRALPGRPGQAFGGRPIGHGRWRPGLMIGHLPTPCLAFRSLGASLVWSWTLWLFTWPNTGGQSNLLEARTIPLATYVFDGVIHLTMQIPPDAILPSFIDLNNGGRPLHGVPLYLQTSAPPPLFQVWPQRSCQSVSQDSHQALWSPSLPLEYHGPSCWASCQCACSGGPNRCWHHHSRSCGCLSLIPSSPTARITAGVLVLYSHRGHV